MYDCTVTRTNFQGISQDFLSEVESPYLQQGLRNVTHRRTRDQTREPSTDSLERGDPRTDHNLYADRRESGSSDGADSVPDNAGVPDGPDVPMNESGQSPKRSSRSAVVKRRLATVPAMLVSTLLAFITAPVVLPILAGADLLRLRRKLPMVRLYLFVLQYLFNDSTEVLLAPWLWVRAGFGTTLDGAPSRRRHMSLQRWSGDILIRRAESLLGLRVEIERAELLDDRNAIVVSRHVNTLDCSLVGAVCLSDRQVQLRAVAMAELLSDPGFDLVYGRLGSVFADRHGGQSERDAIRELGERMDSDSVSVIFPEGRLFRSDRLAKYLARLEDSDPVRAAKLIELRNVLPPHPGGSLSLLGGAPRADVVVLGHVGFEGLPSLAELSKSAPVDHPIRVRLWRFDRATIPMDSSRQVEWLDQRWLELDDWVESQRNPVDAKRNLRESPAAAANSQIRKRITT